MSVSDTHSGSLLPPTRKLCTYYLEEGWHVDILPWVVGVSGLLDSTSTTKVLDFLSLQQQSWDKITEDVAMESVEAFFSGSLHQVRCLALYLGRQESNMRTSESTSGRSDGKCQHRIFDSDEPGRSCN